jgi:hypothetical protein
MDIPVISYNTSVFSAMGYHGSKIKLVFAEGAEKPQEEADPRKGIFPSEARFLRRAEAAEESPTNFFLNAVNHLFRVADDISAAMIGIQEFYPPTLSLFKTRRPDFAFDECTVPTNNASLLTMWNPMLLGDMVSSYHADLGDSSNATKPMDLGRPISIIFTTKGYTLINFHGINRPKYNKDGSETGMDNSGILKEMLAEHAEKAGVLATDPSKIIMMCDSNDREHGINRNAPIDIGGAAYHDGHDAADRSALSCCYNYDSCGISVAPASVSPGPDGMGAAGAESNYAYTGDYVLAQNFKEPVTAVDSPLDAGASIASDHKLVYAIVRVPMAGGRRSNKRKTYRKKNRRAIRRRQSRRV